MDICIAPHSGFGSRASIERPLKPALFTTPEIANTVSTKVGVAPAPRNSFGVRLRASCLLSGRFDHAQPPTTRLSLATQATR